MGYNNQETRYKYTRNKQVPITLPTGGQANSNFQTPYHMVQGKQFLI